MRAYEAIFGTVVEILKQEERLLREKIDGIVFILNKCSIVPCSSSVLEPYLEGKSSCDCSAVTLEFFWDHSQTPKVPPDYNKHLHTLEFPAPDIDLDDLLNNHASFSQIPIAVILERIQRGNILIQDLSKIFHVTAPDSCSLIIDFPLQNRMELEEKEMNYSSQFIKTILSENEIPSSSVAHALMFVYLLH
jgi:hypothetical protein